MAIIKQSFQIQGKKIYIFCNKDMLVSRKNHLVFPNENILQKLKEKDALVQFFYDTCTDSVCAQINETFIKNHEQFFTDELKDFEFIPIRQYFYEADEDSAALAARNASYVNWLNATKYCCTCGHELELYEKENALFCKKCGKIHYPRIEPCIIVLIRKQDRFLMLRHSYRNQDRFTCLAGFMEVGESVEQCVYREVKEEVGLEIENLRYMGSQGWPFPDQLMLAFYADYKCGEVKIQESEILEARWIKPEELENPLPPGSVAWRLVNNKF